MTKYAIQRRGQIELLHLGPHKSFEAQVPSLEPEGMRDAVLESEECYSPGSTWLLFFTSEKVSLEQRTQRSVRCQDKEF